MAFGDNVNDYHCAMADLATRMPLESVDIIIASVSLGAKPQVFSSIASLAAHSLTHRGVLVVHVYTEQLPEAVRRLTAKENERKRICDGSSKWTYYFQNLSEIPGIPVGSV